VSVASRTLGIDLASQPNETGACLIDWTSRPAHVIDLGTAPFDDGRLLDLMSDRAVTKVGVDAPFGWPLAFIDAIATYRDRAEWLDMEANEMRFRATDLRVAQETGQTPLSVAMSDLAWPAMRCARLFSALTPTEGQLDRSGAGRFVEVYPAAALRRWGLVTGTKDASYKGSKPGRHERRVELLAGIRGQLDGAVDVPDDFAKACEADDDNLDAFISALVARSVDVAGCSDPVPLGLRWSAIREGWIHLPTEDSLGRLTGATVAS